MTFALQDAKLWDHIMGSARRPPELKETSNDDEDRKERIYQRWEKVRDFNLDVRKTAAKISRMCADTAQKEFLAVKTSTRWDPRNSGTGSRSVTPFRISHRIGMHLTGFTLSDTVSVRMSPHT